MIIRSEDIIFMQYMQSAPARVLVINIKCQLKPGILYQTDISILDIEITTVHILSACSFLLQPVFQCFSHDPPFSSFLVSEMGPTLRALL